MVLEIRNTQNRLEGGSTITFQPQGSDLSWLIVPIEDGAAMLICAVKPVELPAPQRTLRLFQGRGRRQ